MSNWWDAAEAAYEVARQETYRGHAEQLKENMFRILGLSVVPKCRWLLLEYKDRALFVTYFASALGFYYLDTPLTDVWYKSGICYDLESVGKELAKIDAWNETPISYAAREELLYAYPSILDLRNYGVVSTALDGR
jgi:hypothetical protein